MKLQRGWLALWTLSALVTLGCGGREPAPEQASAPSPSPPTAEQRVAWYQECWRLFSDAEWEKFAGCYAESAESDQVDSGMPIARGPAAIVAGGRQFKAAFPDARGSLQLVLVNGGHIAALSVLTGTHSGALEGGPQAIPATNKPMGLLTGHAVEVAELSNLVTREWFYLDNATMMAQIGVSTAPARPVMTATTAPPTVVVATGSPTESGNIRAFEGQVAAFNAHDLAAVDSFNDPSAVFHMMTDPQDGDAKSNTAALGEFFKAFPDCRLAVEGIWAAGDYVVARLTFTGTNTAASRAMGIAKPTGRSVTVHVFEIGKFANGKLVEDWVIFDGMAFAGQLGLLGS